MHHKNVCQKAVCFGTRFWPAGIMGHPGHYIGAKCRLVLGRVVVLACLATPELVRLVWS